MRTLVVSPERFIEPGTVVRAVFSVTNVGGGTAKAVRVRFALPDGLAYVPGSVCLDEKPLESASDAGAVMGPEGLDIGEVRTGVQRRVAVTYTVAPIIENELSVSLQAAVSSLDTAVIGSNVVGLVVRSKPKLQGKDTYLTLTALSDAVPGAELRIAACVRNAGESSANGVQVVMPVPIGTTYVPGSARIDGMESEDGACREPFGYSDSLMLARTLAPGAAFTLQYRACINPEFPDAAPIVAHASVSSAEIAEFALPKAVLHVSSSAGFDGEQTRLDVESSKEAGYVALSPHHEVRVGLQIRLRLRAHNIGTAAAQGANVHIELPENTAYIPGSLRVDGQAHPEPGFGMLVHLGGIGVRELRELSLLIGVTSPAPNGRVLPLAATLRWSKGSRAFTHPLRISSEPHISRARTILRRVSPSVLEPGDAVAYEVGILNDGTSVARDVVVGLHVDERMKNIEVYRGEEKCALDEDKRVHLGALEPQKPLLLSVLGSVPIAVGDGAELRFGAVVSAVDCVSLKLDEISTIVRARPRFMPTSSFLRLESREPLRPNKPFQVTVGICNEGNDCARDAGIVLRHPADVRLEAVAGATRDGSRIVFGDIEPGVLRQAVLSLRLGRILPRGFTAEIAALVNGRGFTPTTLEALSLTTYAEPNFRDACAFSASPHDAVDAGTELTYALHLRNTGDGVAERLFVKVRPSDVVTYLPGSSRINGHALLDYHGASLLWSEQGLVLNDLAPGIEVAVTWRSIVNAPLPQGTVVRATALLACDEEEAWCMEASPVLVRSGALFSITTEELPFSIAAGPVPAALVSQDKPSPMEECRAFVLPGKSPIVRGSFHPLSENADGRLHLITEFSHERLDRALRFLHETELHSLLTHLLVLRAFFPGISDGSPQLDTLLEEARSVLRGTLDRLFVKARLADHEVTLEDMEDEASRAKVQRLFSGLIEERSSGITSRRKRVIRIVTPIHPRRMEALVTHVEAAPLGSAVPWYALAHLMGEVLEYDGFHAGHIGSYRDALIETLHGFVSEPVCVFHRALTAEHFPHLEEALRNVLSSLQEHVDVG